MSGFKVKCHIQSDEISPTLKHSTEMQIFELNKNQYATDFLDIVD